MQAGEVLHGHRPPRTELVWLRWGNRENSNEEEEEARKALARLFLHFAAPPSQPDPLGFTSDFGHPKAVTFPQTLGFRQQTRVPPRQPPPLTPGLGTGILFHPG